MKALLGPNNMQARPCGLRPPTGALRRAAPLRCRPLCFKPADDKVRLTGAIAHLGLLATMLAVASVMQLAAGAARKRSAWADHALGRCWRARHRACMRKAYGEHHTPLA